MPNQQVYIIYICIYIYIICILYTCWCETPSSKDFKQLAQGNFYGRMVMSYVPRDGRFPGDPHGRVGWGGVGDDNVPCTCTHGRCYATSSFFDLHTWSLLRNIMGWGGVGWGMLTFLALAHMVGATQHHLSLTCTHGRCYATSWDGVGWGGVGDVNVPCTCTHGRCYATSSFFDLHTWSMLRNIIFLWLAHMVAATQHHRMGWGGVGDVNVPCTCTHGRCYATSLEPPVPFIYSNCFHHLVQI